MPTLLKDVADDFVSISTIYIGSQDAAAEARGGPADFTYTLPNYLTDVVAMEMDNYNVPISALSQFTERNLLDFRLRNPAIFGGQWKNLTLELPRASFVYNTPQSRVADLLSLLFRSFQELLLADPDFGGKVDIVPLPDPKTFVTLGCRTLFYDDPSWPGYGSTECEFLFGSGPNKARSVAPVLGFEETDVVFQPLVYYGFPLRYTVSDREAAVNLYRFVDVFIDEYSTSEPFYRVFVPSISSIALTKPEVNARARMLETPLRQAKTLTFRLRLAGGVRPQTTDPFYFNIKVFSLKRAIKAPGYELARTQFL